MLAFYPFKSNRLGIYLGSSPGHSEVDYIKTMPFVRSWKAIGVAGVIVLILGSIEISVLGQAIEVVFSSLLFGRSLLVIYQGRVEIHLGIPGLGMVIREEAAQITSVELVDADPKSLFPTDGRQLLLNSESSETNSPIGSNISESDIIDIRSAIEKNKNMDADLEPIVHIDSDAGSPIIGTEELLDPALANNSVMVLILANLVPLISAFFLGWKLSEIMVLYWAETAIILLYQCAKHFAISKLQGVIACLYSLATAGGFMAMHFLFIWTFFVSQSFNTDSSHVLGSSMDDVFNYFSALWFALAALIVSHGHSFFTNFWPRRELYRAQKIRIKDVMNRVTVMHITIIFGAFLVFATGNNAVGVVLLIVLKIGVDINAHKKHNQPELDKKGKER